MKSPSYFSWFASGEGRAEAATLPADWRERVGRHAFFGAAGDFAPRVFKRRTTSFTTVVGFEVGGGRLDRRRFWLKIYRREPEAAGREFVFLREAAARLSGGKNPGVVEAVALLPEIGGIVTTHSEGPVLSAQLASGEASADQKAALCRDAGVLLARIHGIATPAPGGDFDFASVRAAIRRETEEFPRATRQRLDERAEDLAGRITPEECALRPGHGDYGAYNLIVAADGLVAFDPSFHGAFPRPGGCSTPAEDLAKFAVWLRGIQSRHFAAYERRRWQAAFFSGYREAGGAAFDSESPSFRLLFTYCLLRGLRDWGGLALRVAGGLPRARVLSLWLAELDGEAPASP